MTAPVEIRPSVENLFPGSTIVCIGGGPSLTPEDVNTVCGRAAVIAINDAFVLAPWADVLYGADQKWWKWHHGVPSFTGPKYAVEPAHWPGVQTLRNTGPLGLELDPTGLRTGRNSGYQAINLAVHLGAARIVLLGYDMKPADDGRSHWFGDHPDKQPSPYRHFLASFDSIVEPLKTLGIEVLNCTRSTALTVFPLVQLRDALAERVA